MAAWNAHDLNAVAKLIALDAETFTAPLGKVLNREEYLAVQEIFFTAFPDIVGELWKTVDLGDGWVVIEGYYPGTHLGPFFGIPATGHWGTVAAAGLFRFNAQGQKVFEHFYYDGMTVLGQLGVFDPIVLQAAVVEGKLVVSWPLAPSQGMVLETTDALPGGTWTPVGVDPATVGDQYQVTLEATNAGAFYRLRRP